MSGAHRMFGISSKWWAGVLLIRGQKRGAVDVAKSLTTRWTALHNGELSRLCQHADVQKPGGGVGWRIISLVLTDFCLDPRPLKRTRIYKSHTLLSVY